MRHCGTHSSMLRRNGFHMSTQHASIRWRRHRLNCVRKNSSSVSFFRSPPNHNGSPVSRLLTSVLSDKYIYLISLELSLPGTLQFLEDLFAFRTPLVAFGFFVAQSEIFLDGYDKLAHT